jgi:hypothetical protein
MRRGVVEKPICEQASHPLFPAKAGTQAEERRPSRFWVPAFAGMSGKVGAREYSPSLLQRSCLREREGAPVQLR